MVNLLVADSPGSVSETEVMQVLVPGGTALINSRKRAKPRPDSIDEWTHYLHDADNNAVAKDKVYVFGRRPQYYRWTRPLEYRFFTADKQWKVSATRPAPKPQPRGNKRRNRNEGPVFVGNAENYRWSGEVPVLVCAMALAGKTLLIAGPEDRLFIGL